MNGVVERGVKDIAELVRVVGEDVVTFFCAVEFVFPFYFEAKCEFSIEKSENFEKSEQNCSAKVIKGVGFDEFVVIWNFFGLIFGLYEVVCVIIVIAYHKSILA